MLIVSKLPKIHTSSYDLCNIEFLECSREMGSNSNKNVYTDMWATGELGLKLVFFCSEWIHIYTATPAYVLLISGGKS